jgi:hypothetical protein
MTAPHRRATILHLPRRVNSVPAPSEIAGTNAIPANGGLSKEQVRHLRRLMREREAMMMWKVHQRLQPGAARSRGARLNAQVAKVAKVDATQVAGLCLAQPPLVPNRVGEELLAIEAAVDAIDTDAYGTCIDCRGAIGFTRLLALPTARRCLACQEYAERAVWGCPERAR